MRWATINGVLYEDFPAVGRLLKSIQIKCDQVVEEEALDLATKDEYLGTQYVQRVSITTRWTGTSRSSSGPLFCRGIEEVKCVVQHVRLFSLCITTKDNKSVANQQTSMTNSWTRTLGGGGNWIARETARSRFKHPQVALDGRAVDETAHDVDAAVLGGDGIDGGPITWKRMVSRNGKSYLSLRPRVW